LVDRRTVLGQVGACVII